MSHNDLLTTMTAARRRLLCILTVCPLLAANAYGQTVYDVAGDFSIVANPNGVWSYGRRPALSSPFELNTTANIGIQGTAIEGWDASLFVAPHVWHNPAAVVVEAYTARYEPGAVMLHPGPHGQHAVARWTAPAGGDYSIDATFRGIDWVGTTTDVHVLVNGGSIFDGSVNGYESEAPVAFIVALNAGDDIEFTVGYGNGSHSYDATQLEAEIVLSNHPPTAVAGADRSIHAGDEVHLDGGASFDDNTPSVALAYHWTLTELPPGSNSVLVGFDTSAPSFVVDLPGTYTVRLVVTDEDGLESQADTVQVSSLNLAPGADAGYDRATYVGDGIVLSGSGSADPDEDPLTYLWTITSAPEGSIAVLAGETTVTPLFVPDLPGTYAIQLVVNDGFEDSMPDETIVSVITLEDFAADLLARALDIVVILPRDGVTTKGNQTALANFLTQAIRALHLGDVEEAINKVAKALSRTDGCALRGDPDGPGAGRDWITDCPYQDEVYWFLRHALDVMSS